MASVDDVARLASRLAGVTEGERHGTRTWFVSGKAFAWERPFSKADIKRFGAATPPEGPIVAVAVADLEDKEAVLAASDGAVFTIPHFDGYPALLVALRLVTDDELAEAVVDAWLAKAPQPLADQHLAYERTAGRPPKDRTTPSSR
jgi:hypothetical protein